MNIFSRKFGSNSLKTLIVVAFCLLYIVACNNAAPPAVTAVVQQKDTGLFKVPDTSTIPHDDFGNMVRYGRDLVVNTAHYLGPDGTKGHYLGNKMNCTNCHLDAGTRPFGFNFFSSYGRYPQYRGRENKVLTIQERVNNCIERPHSGVPMPLDCKEMVAIACYIRWVGTNAPVGHHVKGDETLEIDLKKLEARAADPKIGAVIFAEHCSECHGADGQGKWNADSSTYTYPPLWGPHSYQKGSSPHRVMKVARFIKANMPDKKAFWSKPFLTDQQCVDVAAFINDDRIHPRPEKRDKTVPDYPEMKVKAIDYATGPFTDTFSELQHKFGPFQPIVDYHKAHNLPVIW